MNTSRSLLCMAVALLCGGLGFAAALWGLGR